MLREAWDGAAGALAGAAVPAVPPAPAYPTDPTAAYAMHAARFPALEELAAGRLGPDELAAAAIREMLARRRDGHTYLISAGTPHRWPTGPRWGIGLVLTDVPPLAVADVVPRGPAQRAGIRRGQAVVDINGGPCAGLRRFDAWRSWTQARGRRTCSPSRLTAEFSVADH
jgi:C-terminal processing protease CtpA/Prc